MRKSEEFTNNNDLCTDYHVEETRGRTEIRKIFLYKEISGISKE